MTPTPEQIAKTLDLALGWRGVGNIFAAKLRLCDLRRRLRGAQRDALDERLKRARFLREVLEADDLPGRAAFGARR